MTRSIASYVEELRHEFASGLATEHSYRPALKSLLESVDGYHATNEPKRSACGAPDYSIWKLGDGVPQTVGYIEAKDLGASLDAVERGEQMGRYLEALPNLILTNYVEFRWYVNGELRRRSALGSMNRGILTRSSEQAGVGVLGLLGEFLAQSPPHVAEPEDLAERMARLTRLIRDMIVATFDQDIATATSRELKTAFKDVLVPNLDTSGFADMFAQTLAYGLFAARANHDNAAPFRRKEAAYEIPRTNPFLRKLFAAITGPGLDDEPYVGLVDDLAQLLAATDMGSLLATFGERSGVGDPVVHFYETFLAAYDPAVREMRGVYYTPDPVVSYIVSSVDHLLRDRFACPDGLAQVSAEPDSQSFVDAASKAPPRVLVLDPACGTGTFLYAIINRIRDEYRELDNAGKWSGYVRDQLIPRLFGLELLVAPYAVAHLKLGMQLAAQDLPSVERMDWAYDLEGSERLGVYLTNTLEEAMAKSELLLGAYIAEEANAAAQVKRDLPILVVVGNPPYSGHSANKGEWIQNLVRDYAAPQPDIPRLAQGKWLQDDYIKFIRFGQWRIDRAGSGVLAFITNHSYIDSPTFAGMRKHLAGSFTDVYVLDLHGNAKKGERSPDGGADENVFDIQQGVAISIFVKEPGSPTGPARVHRADLHGKRAMKYEWLSSNSLETTQWTSVAPTAPHYLYGAQDADRVAEYALGWSVADIMGEGGKPAPGLVTTQDQFAISFTRQDAVNKVEGLLESESEGDARAKWRLCSTEQWSYDRARAELADGTWESELGRVLYRPFDRRWTVFDENVSVHLRRRASDHLRAGPNVALVTSKQTKGEVFAHVQASRDPVEAIAMSPKTSNNAFVFPLYLYATAERTGPSSRQRRLLIGDEPIGRRSNLDPAYIGDLERRTNLAFVNDGAGNLDTTFGPEDVFHYMFAVLHSPAYRERYADLLRYDFPRIPAVGSRAQFKALVEIGASLTRLHLMEADDLVSAVNYPIKGSDIVESGFPKFFPPGDELPMSGNSDTVGRVYISKANPRVGKAAQYFRGVSPDVWSFQVGGYQVCRKWLKDRVNMKLKLHDLDQYGRMIATIEATLKLMHYVDGHMPFTLAAAEPELDHSTTDGGRLATS